MSIKHMNKKEYGMNKLFIAQSIASNLQPVDKHLIMRELFFIPIRRLSISVYRFHLHSESNLDSEFQTHG